MENSQDLRDPGSFDFNLQLDRGWACILTTDMVNSPFPSTGGEGGHNDDAGSYSSPV